MIRLRYRIWQKFSEDSKGIVMKDYKEILNKQRKYFAEGECKDVEFRITQLSRLYKWICDNENLIMDGLKKDLHKSAFESYATEI